MIRPPESESEETYIKSSWLSSYASSMWAKMCTPNEEWLRRQVSDTYWRGHRQLINVLCARGQKLVAINEADLIAAYIVWQPGQPEAPDALHYVYVRSIERGRGYAKKLVQAAGLTSSVHYTHLMYGIDRKRLPQTWRHNPYALVML